MEESRSIGHSSVPSASLSTPSDAVHLNEARLQSLYELSQAVFPDEPSLIEHALEEAVGLTDSQIGFFHFVNASQGDAGLTLWSSSVASLCAANVLSHDGLADAGMWADSARNGKAKICNDNSTSAGRKGYPEGHIGIQRFMTVPIVDSDSVAAVAGVANKPNDFDSSDLRQLQLFMDGVWRVIMRHRADEAMRVAYATLEERVRERTRQLEETCAALEREMADREKLSDEREDAQRLLQKFSELAPGALYQFVRYSPGNYAVKFCSTQAATIFGLSPESVMRDIAELTSRIHPDDVGRFVESIEYSAENMLPWTLEFRLRHPNGATWWIQGNSSPEKLPDGAVLWYGFVTDVTDRRCATDAVAVEAQRYKSLLETAVDGVHVLDFDGNVIEVNESFCRMLQYSREQLLTMSLSDWEGCLSAQQIKHVLPNTHTYGNTYETKHRRADGVLLDVEVSAKPLVLGDRKLLYCSSRDISDRKRAERALQMSESKYRQLLEQAGDAIVVLDKAGVIAEANAAAVRMFGYSRHELHGLAVEQTYLPEERSELTRRLDNMSPLEVIQYERRLRRKDGEIRHVQISLVRIDEELFQAIYHDVTASKLTEKALRELVVAMEHGPDAVLVTDAVGRITYINPAYTKLTGYSREDVLDKNVNDLDDSDDCAWFKNARDSVVQSGPLWHGHVAQRRRNGTVYQESKTVAPIWDAEGELTGFVCIGRDVTRERELEELLRQAQKMEAVGQLAGGVAHDFNNVLQAISGYADLADALIESQPAQARDHLQQAQRAAERAAALTRQLLAFSRRQMLELRVLDVNKVVDEVVKMVRRVIGEDIALHFIPGQDIPHIYGDSGQVHQVLLNLCLNARDAMPNGGEIRIETGDGIAPSAALGLGGRAERCALLRVSDTGGGIDLDIQDHVFEPFFTTKEVGKGTGLGLATVYGIVQQHHGFIELQSEPGVGTTFRIYFPQYEGSDAPDTLATPVADANSERGCETLLLAEDEDAIRDLAEAVLTRQGYRVLSAADGESAVKLFEAHADEIALAVLDVVMPKKNGRDVYLRLQEMKPGTAVLFCSGYPAIDHRLMLDLDEEILHKPYTISDLIRAVRRKLDDVRDARANESTTD